MISIELPYPPSLNNYYRHVGRRVLISRAGREYRKLVIAKARNLGLKRLDGPLAMQIDLYPPDNRRRDADNSLKALLDAGEHAGLYKDDSQLIRLQLQKLDPRPPGKVVFRIWEVSA